MAKDLYAVLGVQRGASQDDIRKAYRKLARKYHPDVRPNDAAAEQRFKEISQANNVLGDPEKRKLYDEFGDVGLREGFNADQARAYSQFRGGRGGFGGAGGFGGGPQMGGDMNDILSQLFGGGGGPRQRSPFGGGRRQGGVGAKGADVEANLSLDFVDAIKGSERTLTLRVPSATGQEVTKQIKVRIPPGAKDGGKLRLRGKGRPSQRGGQPGDLLLTIQVRSHPHLRRVDNNLELDVPITIGEAISGGKVTVPTLDGQVTVTIPPGSQSGQRMRLKGKGIPKKGGDPGPLYLVLKVVLPKQDSDELKKLAESMDTHYQGDVRGDLRI